MKTVAVIGAGIFGLESAIQLAKAGYEVSLFERKGDVLQEGTANSLLRLHQGLHYPRDLETAIQSREGYVEFLERFPDCVNMNFDNYYAIARSESKIGSRGLVDFSVNAGIVVERTDLSILANIGVDTDLLESAWVCTEGVIDIDLVREQYVKEILEYDVKLRLNNEVVSADYLDSQWILRTGIKEKEHGPFRFVVRASYGLDRISSNMKSITNRSYEFHKTFALEVKVPLSKFGLTIIDGDFLTVLPKGFDESFLIYGPNPSVIAKHIGPHYPIDWDDERNFNFVMHEKQLIERFQNYFRNLSDIEVIRQLKTVRSIQPNMSKTDRRLSKATVIEHNFIDIWSGKIDHCVGVAKEVIEIVAMS
jgi:hypothetical protein